ncbi:MAG: PucR family transcriptional regulator [Eubacteriales bacterium]|nr:PucR family transcriptional regulator [Eubacteriales bacterium]
MINVGITIEELLSLDFLKLSNVIAGSNGIKNNITQINVMEVPDIERWVVEGDFVITTGYVVKDNPEKLYDIINLFNKKKVASLGIKVDRYIMQIPDDVINLANDLNFPIITIPSDLSFSYIISETSKVILNKQINIIREIQDTQEKLTNIMINGGDIKEICKMLYDNTHNSVAIYDDIFSNYVIETENNDDKSKYAIIIEKDKFNRISNHKEEINEVGNFDNINNKNIKRISIPIQKDDKLYGFIYLWEDIIQLTDAKKFIARSTTSYIALAISNRMNIERMAIKHRQKFVYNIISGDDEKIKNAIMDKSLFDFDESNSHQIIYINVHKNENSSLNEIYQLIHYFTALIRSISSSLALKCITAQEDGHIIIVCENNFQNIENFNIRIKKFVNIFIEFIESKKLNAKVDIGIGRNYKRVENLKLSLQEAVQASKINNNKYLFEEMGILRILSNDQINGEYILLYNEYLKPIIEYDKKKQLDLLNTIKVYLEESGNAKAMSRILHVHYNTIPYRLEKIKKISNIDLNNSNDRFLIQILLKIYEMNNE